MLLFDNPYHGQENRFFYYVDQAHKKQKTKKTGKGRANKITDFLAVDQHIRAF